MNHINLLSNLIKNLIVNKKSNASKNYNHSNSNILNDYNNKWDYSNIIYNYNNNTQLSNLKFKYIIKKYINYMLNHKLNNNLKLNIIYKDPIILINKNKYDIILFIYKPNLSKNLNININNNLLISRLINNLINIDRILNIEINIKPIILTYDYLDSNIYNKSLTKHLSKFPKLDTIKNIKINQKILNKILINKLNKNKIFNNINTLLESKSNLNLNNSLLLSKKIYIYSYLLHQYIIGNIWKYRGKNFNSESNARALKSWNDNKLNTSLSLLSLNNHSKFKLNYYLSNFTQSQSSYISKNGKYNVKVKLNHF